MTETDPAIVRLGEMTKEFAVHSRRLKLVVKNTRERAEAEEDGKLKEIYSLVAGSYEELLDTSMSFQSEMLEIILKEWNTAAATDEGDEGEAEDDGEIVGLEVEDAAQIQDCLNTHHSMLDSMLTQATLGDTERENLLTFKTKCEAAIKLVTDLTLPEAEQDA